MPKKILKTIVTRLLTLEAKLALRKYKPKIIAVTGSVGKTSTKEAIYTAISSRFFVRKSEKSFNSEIGVPLTIIGCPNAWNNIFGWTENLFAGVVLALWKHRYPEWLVLEVGADRPGDIKALAAWLAPDIVVVTRFAPVPVHVEFFGSPEEVIKEKSELVKALKEDGLLVLSSDDDDVLALKNLVRRKVMTFGLTAADVKGSHESIDYNKAGGKDKMAGLTFLVDNNGSSVPVKIKDSVGRQVMYSVLAAFSVGLHLGLNAVELSQALSTYVPPNGRMKLLDGIKDTTIIDDTYNSSPVAVREALDTLKPVKTNGKKIAVLGDMMELGKYSVAEHRSVGEQARNSADILLTVGIRARDIAEGALDAGLDERKIMQFDTAKEAGKQLESIISKGDIILIKGSQAVRMEQTVEEIMAHPEDKEKLLVRQEEEWKDR